MSRTLIIGDTRALIQYDSCEILYLRVLNIWQEYASEPQGAAPPNQDVFHGYFAPGVQKAIFSPTYCLVVPAFYGILGRKLLVPNCRLVSLALVLGFQYY